MNTNDIAVTYRQVGADDADPLETVVLLYDVILDDLRRAIEALRRHDVEKRTAEIQHALRVLEQLQGCLDMDRGGEPARNLDRLYSMLRAKLIEAHWKASEDLLRRQIELLHPVRDAWEDARAQQHVPSAEPTDAPPLAPIQPASPGMEWRI